MTGGIDVTVVEQTGARVLLEVSGSVDAFTATSLVDALGRTAHDREVVVDLSRVTFFSAAGVHALETAEELLVGCGGALRLVGVDAGSVMLVLRVLEMQDRWSPRAGGRARR